MCNPFTNAVKKAQAAVEMTVLAALLVLVLLLLFEFGETKLLESASILQVSQARNAVDTLAKAATDVCNEGVGARKRIYVTIPDRVNPGRILIGNSTITIGVYVSNGTTDVSSIVNCPLAQGGFFPTTPGSYWVWVISRTGYVQVGSAVDVEPLNEYFELFPTNSTTTNITFTNYGTSPVNIISTLTWTDSEVTVNINGTTQVTFSLPSGTSNAPLLNLNISANLNASRGLHQGYITITTNTTEREVIPVIVNIVAVSSSSVSYMTIGTYNDSGYTVPSTSFLSPQYVYYTIKTYNSTNNLVNSTVTIRIYNPSATLLYEYNFPAPTSTGVYSSSYMIPSGAPGGSWQMQAYDVGGVSAKTYFTVSSSSDTQAPTYSLNSTNSTKAGTPVLHSLYWQDNAALSGYIFQFCNGTWTGTNCTASPNWADSSCNSRRQLNFTTAFGTENLTNFPVLVALNSSRINYSSTSATDIRFYDSDNSTLLYKETELWNSSGSSYIWVKKPSLNNNTQDFIWAYYNCSNTNNDNKTQVWDSNYVMVQHLNQSSGTLYDSTSYGNNGTSTGGVTYNTAGKIGSALSFDGSSGYINGTGVKLNGSSNATILAWFKTTVQQANKYIVSVPLASSGSNGIDLVIVNSSNAGTDVVTSGGSAAPSSTTNYYDGNWHQIAVTYNSSIVTLYYGGVLNTTSALTGTLTTQSNGEFNIGRFGSFGGNFNGIIDEVEISNTSRSASWINASYLTESDQLITYGSEQAKGNGWVNDTWSAFSGSPATGWSNVTKNVTSTVGANVSWCVYANDTSNNWNSTSCTTPFTYLTTSGGGHSAP